MKKYKDYTKEDWDKLSGYDWSYLLYCQPQFKDSIYYKGWKLMNL